MPHIPAATLQLGSTPYGQTAKNRNAQFGEVSLTSDARVDDTFRSTEHDTYDLADVAGFIEKEHALAQQSLQQARQAFESGVKPNERGLDEQHRNSVKNFAAEADLGTSSSFPKTDWRGVMTSTFVSLQDQSGKYTGQRLDIENGPEGSVATLQTRSGDAVHTISAPVGKDGKVDLKQSSESVEFHTPWISDQVAGRVAANGIKKLDDPRLERLAQAADNGFHLAPGELGEGWKMSTDGDRQTFSTGNESIVLNSADHSFEVHANGWFTGHAGSSDYSVDYEVKNGLKWKDGRFERLKEE